MSKFDVKGSMLKGMGVAIAATLVYGGASTVTGINAEAKTYKLKYTDIGPPRGPRPETMIWWADEIKKRTDGKVQIKFYWSQSLVKGKETLKAVGAGLVDVGTVLGLYTPADLPIWNLSNAPFGGRDPWVGMRTWQDLRKASPELQKETQSKNVRILANFTTGSVDLLSKKPILKAADLEGLKVRATGGWGPLLQKMGATPVRIGFGELYQALDKGTVDATINYIAAVKAYKQYEVANHITEVQMGQVLGFGIGINMKKFNKMPKELQDIILQVSDEMPEEYGKRYQKSVDAARDAMKAGIDGKKIEFHVMDAAERDAWRAQSDFFVKDWLARMKEKGVDGQKIIDQMNALRAKYEKELADKGYPWKR